MSNLFASNITNKLLSAEEISQVVQDQYESLPYPYRDPKDETGPLQEFSPSSLFEVNQYIFGGMRDFTKPFRILAAGGGTGDAVTYLAKRLSDYGCPYEIIHLDLSTPSQKIAAERLKMRGVLDDKVKFIKGSLLDVKEMGLGEFDYIDCCGVLHHLVNTEDGFKALKSVLKPDGGMGIMVYGTLGRTGVYYVQEMLKMLLKGDETVKDKAALVQKILTLLPQTNWMQVNRFLRWKNTNDNEVLDMFCHVQDRSFKVKEICEMMSRIGMRVQTFMSPSMYNPASYINDPEIVEKIKEMSKEQQWEFSELLAGHMNKHIFYIVNSENPVEIPSVKNRDFIPYLSTNIVNSAKEQTAKGIKITNVSLSLGVLKATIVLPTLAHLIIPEIDNKSTIQELFDKIIRKNSEIKEEDLEKDFDQLIKDLSGSGYMYLSKYPFVLKS